MFVIIHCKSTICKLANEMKKKSLVPKFEKNESLEKRNIFLQRLIKPNI